MCVCVCVRADVGGQSGGGGGQTSAEPRAAPRQIVSLFFFFLFLLSFFFFLFLLDTCRTSTFPRQIESLLHAKHPKSDSRTRDPQPQNQTQYTLHPRHEPHTGRPLWLFSSFFFGFFIFFSQIIHRTLNGRHHHISYFFFLFSFILSNIFSFSFADHS